MTEEGGSKGAKSLGELEGMDGFGSQKEGLPLVMGSALPAR